MQTVSHTGPKSKPPNDPKDKSIGKNNFWITKTITFFGNVQMEGFRRRIINPARRYGLAGIIFNDPINRNAVQAIIGGEDTPVSTFILVTEVLMNKLGVEIKVSDANIEPDALPVPFARLPNSVEDEEDRFDKAISILQEMSQRLLILDEMNDTLKRIDKTLPEMNKKLDILPEMNDTLKRIDKTLPEIDKKLDVLPEMNDTLKRIDKTLPDMNDTLKRILDVLPEMNDTLKRIDKNTEPK